MSRKSHVRFIRGRGDSNVSLLPDQDLLKYRQEDSILPDGPGWCRAASVSQPRFGVGIGSRRTPDGTDPGLEPTVRSAGPARGPSPCPVGSSGRLRRGPERGRAGRTTRSAPRPRSAESKAAIGIHQVQNQALLQTAVRRLRGLLDASGPTSPPSAR